MMKHVRLYTNAHCLTNFGPAGWSAILVYEGAKRELSGGVIAATINQVQLKAVVEALNQLKQPCRVELFCESKYITTNISKNLPKWRLNGWLTKRLLPVKNLQEWKQFEAAVARHDLHVVRLNQRETHCSRCYYLAKKEIATINRITHGRIAEAAHHRDSVKSTANSVASVDKEATAPYSTNMPLGGERVP